MTRFDESRIILASQCASPLQELISELDEASVLFSSYRNIRHVGKNDVFKKGGLTISVCMGDDDILSMDPDIVRQYLATMVPVKGISQDLNQARRWHGVDLSHWQETLGNYTHRTIIERQKEICVGLRGTIPASYTELVVGYVGVTNWEAMLRGYGEWKVSTSSRRFILVTCDCGFNRHLERFKTKKDAIEDAVKRNRIDRVIISPTCGGEETMYEVLQIFLAGNK